MGCRVEHFVFVLILDCDPIHTCTYFFAATMACQSIVPMTISQVKGCTHDDSVEGETHIYNNDIRIDYVEVVGQVEQVLRQEPLVFFIGDGTGTLFCCRGPLEPGEDSLVVDPHQHVQIFGKVGYLPQKARGYPESHLYLDVAKVIPVTNYNLVTNHMLRTIHIHLQKQN
ncbi:MAG: hypothetical protein K0U52_09830 [Gammaproteobacteria bacterium]|nr:hypothetical protein [Gammaproteobacteria bacterium]